MTLPNWVTQTVKWSFTCLFTEYCISSGYDHSQPIEAGVMQAEVERIFQEFAEHEISR